MELLEEEEGGVEDRLLLVLDTPVQKIFLEQKEGSNHKGSTGGSKTFEEGATVLAMYGARVIQFCLFTLSVLFLEIIVF
jgi:hypothetical protein